MTLASLALLSWAAGTGVWATFTSSASVAASYGSGSVVIADNDSDTAMLSLSNAQPGASSTGCIQATYTGSLPATVRLYATSSGTGLDQYLDLTVTRGTISSGAFASCTNFSADATNYLGAGNGVIYTGTLQGFPSDYAAGLVEPTAGAPESWTNPETHAYKLVVTLQNNTGAQGKTATTTFTWQATQ
jgi:hypothetical protein